MVSDVPLWQILGLEVNSTGTSVRMPHGWWCPIANADRSITESHMLDWIEARCEVVNLSMLDGRWVCNVQEPDGWTHVGTHTDRRTAVRLCVDEMHQEGVA